MKKYLSCLLLLTIAIGTYASEFMVDGLNYSILSENEVELIGFSSESINYPVYQVETLDIPSTVEYNGVEYNVVSIGANAFGPFSGTLFYSGNFTKVNIPSTIRSIGERAFVSHEISEVKFSEGLISIGLQAFGFNEISDIDFPNSLIEIGEGAFCANPLETTLDTKNIVSIGDFAFSGTSITSLIIGEPLQEIGARAFQECWGLTELKIPGNVVSIGEQAFRSCPNVKQLIIDDSEQLLNIYHSSFDFANNVISIGDPITGVGYEDDSMLETLYIGRQYKSEDKSTSGDNNGNFWTFKGYSRLTSLQFGGSLKEITPHSFGLLPNLKSVSFPSGIEKVASDIFYQCPALSNIKIEPDENNPI
ncbi:MAG: leucine-rich repeat domain-containing protein, partial [Muribaculaceae bacterium]|nr:leucine-rich repeat domain-containing protein [Muribaculaceae bacterium]